MLETDYEAMTRRLKLLYVLKKGLIFLIFWIAAFGLWMLFSGCQHQPPLMEGRLLRPSEVPCSCPSLGSDLRHYWLVPDAEMYRMGKRIDICIARGFLQNDE